MSDWDQVPVNYDDQYWQGLAKKYAAKHGVPENLAVGILLRGEMTNADKVGSKGERGPFQFMPDTRQRFIETYGIDPWISPEANAESAAIHLKESIDKYSDRPEQEQMWLAAAEYNGGPSFAKKPAAISYANRVMAEQTPAQVDMGAAVASEAGGLPDIRARVEGIRARLGSQPNRALTPDESKDAFSAYAAYARGEMDDAQRKEYEEGVQAGTFPLPRGVYDLKFGIAAEKPATRQAPMASESALRRYLGGVKNDPMISDRFTEEERIDFEREVARGNVLVPEGFRLTQTTLPSSWESFKERFKGEKRATEETKTLPSYIDMPEIAAADTLRGIMLSGSTEEIKDAITSTSPDVSVRQDAKGNYIFKSAMDGKEYAIRPGAEWSDLLRVAAPVGVGLATLPATTAMLPATAGAIALGAATGATGQLGVEALRTATGLFDKEQTLGKVAGRVAVAAPIGGGTALAGQLVGSAYRALRPMATAARGAPAVMPEPMPAALQTMPEAPPAAAFTPPAPQAPTISRFRQGPTAGLVPEAEEAAAAAPAGPNVFARVPAPEPLPPTAESRVFARAQAEPLRESTRFRYDLEEFRKAEAAIPDVLPNADKIAGQQAAELLPVMERYRDAALKIGREQSADNADRYIQKIKQAVPESSVFARAKVTEAAPFAVQRAKAGPLPEKTSPFARERIGMFAKEEPKPTAPVVEATEGADDPLFQQAKDLAEKTGESGYKAIQDYFGVGFQRASRISEAVRASMKPAAAKEVAEAAPAVARAPTPLKQTIEDAEDVAEAALATPPLATAITQAEAAGIPRGDLIRLVQDASVGGIRGKGRESAVKELAAAINLDPEVVESAARIGITEFLQPDHVTTDVAVKGMMQAIKAQKGSQLNAAEQAGFKSIADKVQQLFDDYTAKDISEIGEEVKASMSSTVKSLEDKADEIYTQLRESIGGATQVNPISTTRWLKKKLKEANNDVSKLSGIEQKVYEMLKPSEIKKVVSGKEKIVSVPPTYAILSRVQREVGRATYKSGDFKDADTGIAKALYSVLSKDMDRVAKEYNVSALAKAGSKSVATRKAIEDDMEGLMGKELWRSVSSAVEAPTAGLSKGKANEFVRVVTMVPKEFRKDMLSANIRKIFLRRDNQGPLDGARDFVKWYGGIKVHKQAMAALYDNIEPNLRQQLEDLYKVYNGIFSARAQRSDTGISAKFASDLNAIQYPGGVLARIYQWAVNKAPRAIIRAGVRKALPMIVGGETGESLLAATLGASKAKDAVIDAADKLFMSEPFNSLVIKRAAGETITPQQVKTVASSSRFKEYAKKLNIPVYQHERWIYSMLGAPAATESREAMR